MIHPASKEAGMFKMYLWQMSAAQLRQLEHGEVFLYEFEDGRTQLMWVEWVTSDCVTVHI